MGGSLKKFQQEIRKQIKWKLNCNKKGTKNSAKSKENQMHWSPIN